MTRTASLRTRFATRYAHPAAAFAFALATTLAIFSGVGSLATTTPSGALWVQAQQSSTQA